MNLLRLAIISAKAVFLPLSSYAAGQSDLTALCNSIFIKITKYIAAYSRIPLPCVKLC